MQAVDPEETGTIRRHARHPCVHDHFRQAIEPRSRRKVEPKKIGRPKKTTIDTANLHGTRP